MKRTHAGAGEPDVLLVHPSTQHSFQTAVALAKAGRLQRFLVSVRVTSRQAKIARAVHRRTGNRLDAVRHRHDGLDPDRIASFPLPFLLAAAIRAAPRSRRSRFAQAVAYNVNFDLFDLFAAARVAMSPRPPRIVHVTEDAASLTARATHRRGGRVVLDVAGALEFNERAIRQVAGPSPLYSHHARRARTERALADVVLVPSAHVERCLLEHGVPSAKLRCVPYGVDVARFPVSPRPPEIRRWLFLGRVGPRKGVDDLFEAWRLGTMPDGATLTVAGPIDATWWASRQVPPGVEVLGPISRDAVPALFGTHDAFVFPTLSEGSALVVYEAMASGLPVVTTPEAGSVIRDGHDGIVVPASDPRLLAEVMAELTADARRARLLGDAAAQRVRAEFTWEHYHGRIESVYRDL